MYLEELRTENRICIYMSTVAPLKTARDSIAGRPPTTVPMKQHWGGSQTATEAGTTPTQSLVPATSVSDPQKHHAE